MSSALRVTRVSNLTIPPRHLLRSSSCVCPALELSRKHELRGSRWPNPQHEHSFDATLTRCELSMDAFVAQKAVFVSPDLHWEGRVQRAHPILWRSESCPISLIASQCSGNYPTLALRGTVVEARQNGRLRHVGHLQFWTPFVARPLNVDHLRGGDGILPPLGKGLPRISRPMRVFG